MLLPTSGYRGRLGLVALAVAAALALTGCGDGSWAQRRGGGSEAGLVPGDGSGSATPGAATGPVSLVALGDSYSSGEGNPPYDGDAPSCDRGAGAWPRLLANDLGAGSSVRVLACSGATTAALTNSFNGQPPQLDALAALGGSPSIVTVTIGGNDAGFGPTIASCVIWRCFWTGSDNRAREFVKNQLPAVLETSYTRIKEAAPNARVLVVGYPEIIPSQSRNTCGWLDNTERRQLDRLNSELNRVARRAADEAGVEFVSLDDALDGHELCTADPWVHPVSLVGAGLQASAHPNAAGQAAIADAVREYLDRHD
ncbi:MAG: SGNH/GDSL hydrolase family protein [Frankia sp.]|nr:SGNH/GDSL hydrolase family protein [Frankia sp.]